MLRALLAYGIRGSLYQQHTIRMPLRTVRVDFAVFHFVGDRMVKLAIEVDGYEWHQKTKQQVERDYRRDRELQRMGWIVHRFSGTEVARDAEACAAEVLETISACAARITAKRSARDV